MQSVNVQRSWNMSRLLDVWILLRKFLREKLSGNCSGKNILWRQQFKNNSTIIVKRLIFPTQLKVLTQNAISLSIRSYPDAKIT